MRRLPLAIVLAFGLFACGDRDSDEIETTGVVPVSVEKAHRGALRAVLNVAAVVKPATGAELIVIPPQTARIAELPVGVGDRVRRGGLLVRFEIPSLAAERATRESEVKSAQAGVESAQAAAARAAHLYDRGIAAGKDAEAAKRDRAAAESALASSQSALDAAKLMAERAVVRAPFDGVVVARAHNPGDMVDASSADPVVRFVDPAHLQLEAAVPVGDFPKLTAGAQARVIGPEGYAPESASVIAVPGAVDPATAIAIVRLRFERPTALPSGTPVHVEIASEGRQDVLIVPASAIVREGDDAFVFTVESGGIALRHKVAVGLVAEPDAEIVSGIDAGATVITSGASGLPDGAKVSVRE